MYLPQSPLVRFTFTGIAAGFAIGFFLTLNEPAPKLRDIPHGPPRVIPEYKMKTQWNITKVHHEDDPTKFEYDVKRSAYSYTAWGTVNGDPREEPPIWWDMISSDLINGDFIKALDYISKFRNRSNRTDALLFVVSSISVKQPPYYAEIGDIPPSSNPEPVPSINAASLDAKLSNEEITAKYQVQLEQFFQSTTQEVNKSLELAETIGDHGVRAKILMELSILQRSLGNENLAKQTVSKAQTAFHDYQIANHGAWSKVKKGYSTILGWAGVLNIGTFLSGLFIKILGHYFVETIAHKVGDEKFAKALGATLKSTVKESGLILPDSFIASNRNRSQKP